ncbi:MAG: hypothetical protein IJ604_09665 [Prevotella sp.]|nr:hypothetical protein [Prevotella sp.]
MRKIERSLIRNPDFSQSSELPLFTKGLLFLPELQNNAQKSIILLSELSALNI